jgi:hypothetical protein
MTFYQDMLCHPLILWLPAKYVVDGLLQGQSPCVFDPRVLVFGREEEPVLAGAPAKTPIDAPDYMRI